MEIANKLVSIYIPTCNRLSMLKRALQSIFNQTYENIEILICDDGSTDGTEEYVKNLIMHKGNIKYFRTPVKSGACAARNMGIFSATGYFITGLDDDDEFHPRRIEIFVSSWNDKYSFVCSDYINRFSDGKIKKYRQRSKQLDLDGLLLENRATNQVFTLTKRLQSIGGFDIRAKRYQDWDTWIRLCHKYGEFKNINEFLYIMNHDHLNNESRVTNSYPAYQALTDLKDRNLEKYKEGNLFFVNYLIDYYQGNSKLKDAVKASLIAKNVKFLIKDILSKFGVLKKVA